MVQEEVCSESWKPTGHQDKILALALLADEVTDKMLYTSAVLHLPSPHTAVSKALPSEVTLLNRERMLSASKG